MDKSKPAGFITGTLTLTIQGSDPIDLGTLPLPLIVTKVYNDKTGGMALGLGVNLEFVRADIAGMFSKAEMIPQEEPDHD